MAQWGYIRRELQEWEKARFWKEDQFGWIRVHRRVLRRQAAWKRLVTLLFSDKNLQDFTFGRTGNAMKATGVKASFMAKESRHCRMGPSLTAIGRKGDQLDRACANTLMEPSTQEVGSMDNLMEWESKYFPTEPSTQAIGLTVRRTVEVSRLC